jgi:hypothetical protein
MNGLRRLRHLVEIAILAGMLAGCVPVPFRPSAAVTHTAVTTDETATRVEVARKNSEARSVATAIQHDEPRVQLIDPAAIFVRLGDPNGAKLGALMIAAHEGDQALAADYVLSVGEPTYRQLHDTGAAAPFLFMPSMIGYEKIQSQEVLPAILLDLRDPQAFQVLCASSTYSEVATGLVYGVMTIAMPEPALRNSLAREVAHTVAAAQPEGPIRLLVVSQERPSKDAASLRPTPGTANITSACGAKPPPAITRVW